MADKTKKSNVLDTNTMFHGPADFEAAATALLRKAGYSWDGRPAGERREGVRLLAHANGPKRRR